ncbi:bifunctional UDP-N-acetylglucosamine diphosphorylase/glucosamine-1-phosphate N-acetyltransferase GlmU [Gulosibacter sp. 10]|uniref:bifunctional UDP-N-acetylglucosamine diphosphorylase/glucosamine-1-phosphate N-acetyltransferase GlmU n=1 Tax=Gulosibacter sp. 10 TaxID=1255570 RepID=UPI00097EC0C6|nr:bifunctional UDP-N-acetylglucosamine diphosphorylase/glucosamine-1-phosphate N-acetyltransferase GlmU [Gulosibacter sp. 10]SJM50007.1 N-acetylglucosamine-1-phosphate uridyltransferase / Glucosamine-1-phosphate N-acetyltransferase [Gulosibacter sp. 10]
MTDNNLAIIILAAGKGTRMKSKTPKVLHSLGGIPLIGHVLRTAAALQPTHTVAVVRHERDRVVEAIRQLSPEVLVADQDETPGTGRAVEVGLDALPEGFDGDVVVLSGDVPLLDSVTVNRLLETHREERDDLTLLSAFYEDPTGFGRIVRDADGVFESIVEHGDASEAQRRINEINAGVYAFSARACRSALDQVDQANEQGEKYLTDTAKVIKREGGRIAAFGVTDPWLVQGINDRAQLGATAREYNRRILDRWMKDGVTILDPDTTTIDADVTIGRDVEILPGTQLRGATTIAEDAIIGPDTTLVDCEVGAGATVKRTDATLSVIGERATIGPWSYLRANTVVGAGGKVGAFVETKNSTLGAGAKVPHLSYVGDAEIGEGSNLGAGSITANYDGVNKHRTVVGRDVKIGSDNVLIAPVTVGDGAYTGAGTSIRKDVPAGALAVNVAPQRNVEGWTAKNRPGTKAAESAASASAEGGSAAPGSE